MSEIINKLAKISRPIGDRVNYILAIERDHINKEIAKIEVKFNVPYSKNPASPLLGLVE